MQKDPIHKALKDYRDEPRLCDLCGAHLDIYVSTFEVRSNSYRPDSSYKMCYGCAKLVEDIVKKAFAQTRRT